MTEPAMTMWGQCPVQGEAAVDGWLCYFRARDGWSFRAWKPGRWERWQVDDRTLAEVLWALAGAHDNTYSTPDFLIEDGEGPGFPEPTEDENWYEGWWSHEYAGKVAAWCIDRLRDHVREGLAGEGGAR